METHSGPILKQPDAEFGGTLARAKLERRLLWKIDLRMSILIDRNNAAAAHLHGLEKDLHLKGQQSPTPWLLSILYVGYIIFQIPSNMFLNHIGKPSVYLPASMLIWGCISILTGVTTNFMAIILHIGHRPAAFFPGALFLLSKWYKWDELGLRTALLYCGNLISNVFGSLIATGVLNGMDDKLGHTAWQWWCFDDVFAVVTVFILPDFPKVHMAEDVGETDSESGGHLTGLILAVTDWKVWWMGLALTAMAIGLSYTSNLENALAATLGYSWMIMLLLCAPPWGFVTVIMFIVARHGDKTGERFFHIITPLSIGIVGFIIVLSVEPHYFALCLMAQSYAGFICPHFPVLIPCGRNSFPHPPAICGVVLALINSFSQFGNITGSWGKSRGNSTCLVCLVPNPLCIAHCLVFREYLHQF
ncbi:hypothetical protein BS47DRAFT_1373596 [Hydnum rufescens UP504]|uniref:MFS general substrate transporter n=1 Tax=Hydnum rufescens UP504 TaxID=1448309 RepID=A0A9P6ANU3_9AGAM|nr:hypothetical protein BS47DRAFT_1373596 [Hydnum rufescens UP504]